MIETTQLSQILGDLSDADPAKRRAAAEALSEGDERGLYPLVKALHDDNAGVQDAAMRSLIAIGGETTAYMVLPLLREGPLQRNTTLLILKEIGPPAVPLLRSLFEDKDDDIRKFALDLISDIRTCDYPAEIVKLMQIDTNANVRASAAKALAILNYREAIPALIAALRDEEWVAFSALDALAHFGDDSTLVPVRGLLGSPSTALRYAAIEALGKFASSRAGAILHEYFPKADEMEKSAVIKSLVQCGVTSSMTGVVDALLAMVKEGEWEDRLIAMRGLMEVGDKRALPVIVDVAGQLDPADPRDEERLIEARDVLQGFGSPEDFMEMLNNPMIKYRGKVIVVDILRELECREALPGIIALLEVTAVPVVLAAAEAVSRLAEPPEAQEILTPLREHADQAVRERVAWLLEG